jgi:hypothetical protein
MVGLNGGRELDAGSVRWQMTNPRFHAGDQSSPDIAHWPASHLARSFHQFIQIGALQPMINRHIIRHSLSLPDFAIAR